MWADETERVTSSETLMERLALLLYELSEMLRERSKSMRAARWDKVLMPGPRMMRMRRVR